ncbi:hypothetical protein AC579_8697 [Pseudocercospora musae]|uniref:Uncharacterized protein n=1 Tax=Pseudocercospora musae TaxID=113226 RepID=A0A139I0S2_9PEZI|nr:hypothetical protein AC579_8697 [Pseudocercospora musae]
MNTLANHQCLHHDGRNFTIDFVVYALTTAVNFNANIKFDEKVVLVQPSIHHTNFRHKDKCVSSEIVKGKEAPTHRCARKPLWALAKNPSGKAGREELIGNLPDNSHEMSPSTIPRQTLESAQVSMWPRPRALQDFTIPASRHAPPTGRHSPAPSTFNFSQENPFQRSRGRNAKTEPAAEDFLSPPPSRTATLVARANEQRHEIAILRREKSDLGLQVQTLNRRIQKLSVLMAVYLKRRSEGDGEA